ncbi:MAG: DUF2298 domain-containing protein [Candidatus Sumerlaeia bacterium]|nr:DUF2298 domain-containing protein [Candidatus Sumerlaeia bacterium]
MWQLLNPNWWVPPEVIAMGWWLACAVAGSLLWPLTLRLFRGLAEDGSALAVPFALVIWAFASWSVAHPWGGPEDVGLLWRVLLLGGAAFWGLVLIAFEGPLRPAARHWTGPALLVVLGVLALPLQSDSAWGVLLALAAAGLWAWRGEYPALRRRMRRGAVPFVVGQLLFLLGFLFFCGVRSHLPAVTFVLADYPAEKLGNMTHLSSVLRSGWMPPQDAWFGGYPTNYYYGGHYLVALLAKAVGAHPAVAFNLGLATVFSATLTGATALGWSAAAFARRRPRVALRGPFAMPRGLGFALFGGVATALFGNLDAVQQVLTRAEGSVPHAYWIDFWRSSRAIKGTPQFSTEIGTITEFPYFSAILGDLHPHHMALLWTIPALASCLLLWRLASALRPRTEGAYALAAVRPLLLMAFFIGAVFPVNIWDSIVLSFVFLLFMWQSRRTVQASPLWNQAAYALVAGALAWLGALLLNGGGASALASPAQFAIAVVVLLFVPFYTAFFLPAAPRWAGHAAAWTVAGLLMISGGILGAASSGAPPQLGSGARDAALLLGAAAIAALVILQGGAWVARFASVFGVYGVVGGLALAVCTPFRYLFRSPLGSGEPLLGAKFPPYLNPYYTQNSGVSFLEGAPFGILPKQLQTTVAEFGVHWGLLLALPALALYSLGAALGPRGRRLAAVALGAAVAAFVRINSETWVLPLTSGATVAALLVLPASQGAGRLLLLLGAPFLFWTAWCEAFFINDTMTGDLERYNTLFKIYYPLWPLLGAAGAASLAALMDTPKRAQALFLAGAVAGLGFAYPLLATATRTNVLGEYAKRHFDGGGDSWGGFNEDRTPEHYTTRTLDGSAWLDQDRNYVGDRGAIEWLRANAEPGARLLEAPSPQGYSGAGRIAAFSGVPSVVGWINHENQWRGWSVPAPFDMQRRYFAPVAPRLESLEPMLNGLDGLRPLSTQEEREAYRLSLAAPAEFDDFLRGVFPESDPETLVIVKQRIEAARNRGFVHATLIERLNAWLDDIWRAPRLSDATLERLRFLGVRYVVVGSIEREMYPPESIAKFSSLETVYEDGETRIHRVPVDVEAAP